MSAHAKYQDRYTTAVSMERKLHRVAKALKIEFSEALEAGLQFYIRMRISDNDRRLTPELLQDFKDIQFKNVKVLEAYIRLKSEEQQTLDKILEMEKEVQKEQEIIEVWDRGEETYIRIPRSRFNPESHVLKGAPA